MEELRDAELRLELGSFARSAVHRAPMYSFRMVHAESGEEMGPIRLRVGSTPQLERSAGHIGYGVQERNRGHRYATRSARLLMPLARRQGLGPLWITCDPDHAAARRRLGAI